MVYLQQALVDWQTEAYLNSTNINIVRAGLQRHGYTFSSGSGRTQDVCGCYL